jgi:hypothetical protein
MGKTIPVSGGEGHAAGEVERHGRARSEAAALSPG